jgi:hypothetical protein
MKFRRDQTIYGQDELDPFGVRASMVGQPPISRQQLSENILGFVPGVNAARAFGFRPSYESQNSFFPSGIERGPNLKDMISSQQYGDALATTIGAVADALLVGGPLMKGVNYAAKSFDSVMLPPGARMASPEFGGIGVEKYLPQSSSLAIPEAPSLDIMNKYSRVESVPLDSARATQRQMQWGDFNEGKHPGPLIKGFEDKPVAVRREDGEYLIFDGHHRAAKAKNLGAKTMDMYVIDAKTYAPELAGRKPAPQTISDDDLLRELMGGNYNNK